MIRQTWKPLIFQTIFLPCIMIVIIMQLRFDATTTLPMTTTTTTTAVSAFSSAIQQPASKTAVSTTTGSTIRSRNIRVPSWMSSLHHIRRFQPQVSMVDKRSIDRSFTTTMTLKSSRSLNDDHDAATTTTTIATNKNNTSTLNELILVNYIMPWMSKKNETIVSPLLSLLPQQLLRQPQYRLPPFLVEDWNVLLYDVLLIINLVVSISVWVVHRYDVSYIGIAFSEGCLLSLLWIISGLLNGSFLYTAIDGHQTPGNAGIGSDSSSNSNNNSNMSKLIKMNSTINDEVMMNTENNTNNYFNRGGPMAAGLLAFHTYINTMNLRLIYALIIAIIEHRPALSTSSELLIPLEFGYGILLMILWRTLHSSYILR